MMNAISVCNLSTVFDQAAQNPFNLPLSWRERVEESAERAQHEVTSMAADYIVHKMDLRPWTIPLSVKGTMSPELLDAITSVTSELPPNILLNLNLTP